MAEQRWHPLGGTGDGLTVSINDPTAVLRGAFDRVIAWEKRNPLKPGEAKEFVFAFNGPTGIRVRVERAR